MSLPLRRLGHATLGLGAVLLAGCSGSGDHSMPGMAGAMAPAAPATAATGNPVAFPAGYQRSFTQYATVNRADERKQVVKLFANDAALASARDGAPLESGSVLAMEIYKATLNGAGEPVVGPDGYFIPAELTGIAVMENRAGWGMSHPEEWRNGSWEYALFNQDGSAKEADLQKCFACHKPKEADGYLFSLSALRGEAGS
jgi:hypothetical protein